MTVKELQRVLKKCWSKETSADLQNWTPENPSWGQCAVTALVVQDFFGGELLRTGVRQEESIPERQGLTRIIQTSHYWNLLPDGREVDFTRNQFPEGVVIPKGEPRTRKYVLSFTPTRKRFALLRLAVENLIQPNPLFSDPIYQLCLETALISECQKMIFCCVVVYEGRVVTTTANQMIEPLRPLCEPECIRLKIQSRTESMLGACAHAEEWAEVEMRKLGLPPQLCSFYIAGFDAKTTKPWVKKEAADHTCLRCAVHMCMAGVGKIWVPFIDRWESLTPKEAVEKSAAYALKEKKI